MACCIIAAFLFAQFMAMVRRWGVFWGLLPVPEGEVADTAYTRLAAWCRRPMVRGALAIAVVVEMTALGGWAYIRHGTHIAEFADVQLARIEGQRVVYAPLCTQGEQTSIRLVLDEMRDRRQAGIHRS